MSMSSDRRAFDEHMMRIAIAMARRGIGATAPNPAVGAVIADETTGELISRGWTQPGGRPHAEKEALRRSAGREKGRTMYVTLEPCAHTGRVPTCADSMQASGLKRVVCAIPDPNPVVSGRGFAQLRAAGMEVDVGLLADEARWITLGHILRVTRQRPFVQLKMALDSVGAVAAGDGAPVWVTSPDARAYAHLLRAEADAILVGSGTVFADDPELTCRLPGLSHRSPDRIVLDTHLRTPPTAKVFRQEGDRPRVWVAAAAVGPLHHLPRRHGEGGAVVLDVAGRAGRGLHIGSLLAALAENGLTRLMVEGGPTTWQAFLESGFVDEACLVFGAGKAEGEVISVIPGDPDEFFARYELRPVSRRPLGPDRLLIYRHTSR
jgi:diaminohydroxyphosphoribosylaminopyrimidine deaminase / 5-amino-6-(5-phosphoribosylamino)uracil reductase